MTLKVLTQSGFISGAVCELSFTLNNSPSAPETKINVPEPPLLIYDPYDEHSQAVGQ